MSDPSQSPFDRSLERLGKLSGILVPIVIAFVGWFYTATKDKNDALARADQVNFDRAQKQYANLTALLPLLTSKDKSQFDLGVQIYTSEAVAHQAPTDQLQGYLQSLTISHPEDAAVQQAAAAGLSQQAAVAPAPPSQQCKANPEGLYLQVANSTDQLALGRALAQRLKSVGIPVPVQGTQRIDQGPGQTQVRYYPSATNDQKLAGIKAALDSAGVHVMQDVNLNPGFLKPGCTPPPVFELWIGTSTPLTEAHP